MGTVRKVETLVSEVRDGIGLDIYGLFDGDETRYLLMETIVTTIIVGLVLEYLKGLLRPKEVGEQRSKSLGALVGMKKHEALLDDIALRKQLTEALELLRNAPEGDQREAFESFRADLVNAGVAVATADVIAKVIYDSLTKST